MKIVRLLTFLFVFGIIFLANAEEATQSGTLIQKPQPGVKRTSVITDFQWIRDLNKIQMQGYKSATQYAKFHVKGTYKFSDITNVSLNIPFGFFYQQDDYSGLGQRQVTKMNWILDRVKASLDAKLFPDTLLGDISWNVKLNTPTILGSIARSQRFYNHTDLSLGLTNFLRVQSLPLFVLGSFSWIKKFDAKYQEEVRRYGDEFSGSFGLGYSVHSKIHPNCSLQYSYVGPMETRQFGMVSKTDSGAQAVHVVPALSIPLTYNFSINGIARVLLYRSEVTGLPNATPLWGSFEDEGDLSITLGARLGLM
ncbi:MAG: hypothetical protein A3B70_03070 [Deltaproteobacteria bacterium RIFCSPHIGHO2_02_FULL_40_11]|nr:MAG: hypothetical protein A3B70_03070 [Deltaproteobacteria bacterium RIFCSPHIGHO2_02_FULL_40_11]